MEYRSETELTSDMIKVSKCVCSNMSFADLKEISEKAKISDAEELARHTGVAQNCRLCFPYLEAMLKDGATEIPLIKITKCEEGIE